MNKLFFFLIVLIVTTNMSCKNLSYRVVIDDIGKPYRQKVNIEHNGWGVFGVEILENSSGDSLTLGDKTCPPFFTGQLYVACIPGIKPINFEYTPIGQPKGRVVLMYYFIPDKTCID